MEGRERPPRILHVGNLANFPFRHVKALRRKGLDVDLLIPKVHPLTEDPASEEGDIGTGAVMGKMGFPEWIRCWDNTARLRKLNLIRILREYDLLHTYTEYPIAGLFSFRPYIAHSTGSDLREQIFANDRFGVLLRQAYKRSGAILFSNPDQIRAIRRLGLLGKARFLPAPIDTERYSPTAKGRDREGPGCRQGENTAFEGDPVIFHPSRQEWRIKGNELLILAFARLTREVPGARLVIVDWGLDRVRTRTLIASLELSHHVAFIPPVGQQKLVRYYNMSDIVVDQFRVGSIGGVSIEAMSCAKPVVAGISEEEFRLCYPELPPLACAHDEKSIHRELYRLATDAGERKRVGDASRAWVVKYHYADAVAQKVADLYESVLRA